ncbi:PEPxxWA-CTERM sorting domain-containing protein [Polymorphobacter sp. PAMC 29334]|nr:PEPxxWA-CTERM sorting domain-containing protein [Polymorphobacter sp. PAMC 29334]
MKYLRLSAVILIAGFGAGAAQATQLSVAGTGYIITLPTISYDFSFAFNESKSSQLTAAIVASLNFDIGGLNGTDVIKYGLRNLPNVADDFYNFRIDPNTVTVTQVVHPAPQTWTLSAISGAKLIFKNGAYILDFGNVLTDSSNAALLNIANISAPVDGETLNGGFFAPRYDGDFALDFRLNLPQTPFDIAGGRNSNIGFGFETAGLATGDYYSTALLDTSRYLFGDAQTGDTFTPVTIHARIVDILPVAGVPEPAAWTMIIAGFGFVGSALRRRVPQVA